MAAPAVDHTSQGLKQFRGTMNLVKNHESILDAIKVQNGFRETITVIAVLKIEIDRVALIADVKCQCGLARLSRADNSDCRLQL